jgi:hypothetical protein
MPSPDGKDDEYRTRTVSAYHKRVLVTSRRVLSVLPSTGHLMFVLVWKYTPIIHRTMYEGGIAA